MTELVRYRPAVYMEPCLGGMFNDEFGEYVTYSQASEIIAAKGKEINQLKADKQRLVEDRVRFPDRPDDIGRMIEAEIGNRKEAEKQANLFAELYRKRAEAAESKLAQYEAQKPIGFVSPSFFDSLNIKNAYSVAAFVVMEKSIKYNTPLYASPAPAADLKAENSDYFMIDDGISYIHTDDLLKPTPIK